MFILEVGLISLGSAALVVSLVAAMAKIEYLAKWF